jgi:tRNA threonylcarbamoyladenosine biosynthesis protein TsaB
MTRAAHPVLLAIDTSTRTVGLALYDGVGTLAEYTWTSPDYHTVELAPAISDILAKSQLKTSDLAAIGVATGPGSFTGLRIGLALAKGLALSQNLTVIGIPTLDILASSQPSGQVEKLAAILKAGRGRLAVGWYRSVDGAWQPGAPLEVLTAAELSERIQSPTLVSGELSEEERRLLSRKRKNVILASPALCQRRPSYLAELAWQRWQAGKIDDPATLSPIYLHYNEPIPG